MACHLLFRRQAIIWTKDGLTDILYVYIERFEIQKHLLDNVQTSIIQTNGTMWKQINYFLMSICLETLVKAVRPLSKRSPENVCKHQAHYVFKIRQQLHI